MSNLEWRIQRRAQTYNGANSMLAIVRKSDPEFSQPKRVKHTDARDCTSDRHPLLPVHPVPVEVMLNIVRWCDTATLGALSRTCKSWYLELQPKLSQTFWMVQPWMPNMYYAWKRPLIRTDVMKDNHFCIQGQSGKPSRSCHALAAAIAVNPEIRACTSFAMDCWWELNDVGVMYVARTFPLFTNLQHIDMNNSLLQESAMSAFIRVFPVTLTSLTIYHGCDIKSPNVEILRDRLAQCTSLQVLCLNSTHISGKGMTTLAPALQHLTKLQSIRLNGCNIARDGARALSNAIAGIHSLTDLQLSSNNISSDGVRDLAISLRHMTGLRLLNLSINSMQDTCAEELSSTMCQLTNLVNLQLDGNHFRVRGGELLATALRHMKSLQKLNLRHNKLGLKGVKAILAELKSLKSNHGRVIEVNLELNRLNCITRDRLRYTWHWDARVFL